jgi:hypothetical protein
MGDPVESLTGLRIGENNSRDGRSIQRAIGAPDRLAKRPDDFFGQLLSRRQQFAGDLVRVYDEGASGVEESSDG